MRVKVEYRSLHESGNVVYQRMLIRGYATAMHLRFLENCGGGGMKLFEVPSGRCSQEEYNNLCALGYSLILPTQPSAFPLANALRLAVCFPITGSKYKS